MLYQTLSICQERGRREPRGVVLQPCAYNPSPALSGDKKKYIRQNKSSLEPQKERRLHEAGKNSPEGWSTGNPVSTEAPQTLRLGKGLSALETGSPPPPPPPHSSQTAHCRVRPEGLVQRESSEETQRSWSRKVRGKSSLGSTPLSQAFLWERPHTRTRQVRVHRSECTSSPHLTPSGYELGIQKGRCEGVWYSGPSSLSGLQGMPLFSWPLTGV